MVPATQEAETELLQDAVCGLLVQFYQEVFKSQERETREESKALSVLCVNTE